MAYIGNIPAEKYQTLQKQIFTTSATDTYTLDYAVTNPQDLALFLNNVRQNPNDAYSVSNTTLTLSSAITSSDTMYAVFLGRAVETVAPAIGSVTNDMLAGSIANAKLANSSITLNGSAVSLGGSASVTNTPAFLVKKSSNQTVSSTTTTLITWDNEIYDTNNAFDSNSFTVPSGHAGKYIIYCTMNLQGGSADNYFMNQIMVNNTLTQYNIARFVGSGGISNNIVASLDLSVGDYVTIKVLHNTGSNKDIDYNKLTWFGGFKLIGA